jgi:hypothetical protein
MAPVVSRREAVVVFIPPVSPGHVDPESERYNAKSRIQDQSVWGIALGWLVRLVRRGMRSVPRERDPYGW